MGRARQCRTSGSWLTMVGERPGIGRTVWVGSVRKQPAARSATLFLRAGRRARRIWAGWGMGEGGGRAGVGVHENHRRAETVELRVPFLFASVAVSG